ncbi:MAG: hypothetical protein H6Q90_1154 [Deltaproteobacteria bacterium]|nr:hypothetical protein [Deltaproteobacteria bacterium]
MSKLAALIIVSACAPSSTVGSRMPAEASPHGRIQFDPHATGDAAPASFPAALELSVPAVDRVAHLVRARLGETATAELELCVSPDGHVAKAELVRGSSLAAFDRALVHDAESWQFATLPGPASVQSCRRTTIAYRIR